MLPQVHAIFLSLAAVGAVAMGGIILARNPSAVTARLHFVYAAALAWWFICMAMIAGADTEASIDLWGRLLHLSLGILPGVLFHLNTALAGQDHLFRTRIRGWWIVSGAVTLYGLFWPGLFGEPSRYAWGAYVRYTPWGAVVVAAIVVSLVQATGMHRRLLAHDDPRSVRSRKAKAFYFGNFFTATALIDFLPVFGVAVYPAGYLIITVMHVLTLYGAFRFRLTEITPEFAAEHVLREMPDGLLLIDSWGCVRMANPMAAETLGCAASELVDRPLGAAGRNQELLEILRKGIPGHGPQEISFSDRAGAPRHLRVSATSLTDEEGVSVAQLWTLRCITAEKLARQETERLEVGVRNAQKLETLGVMASGIAHDFNNVLLTILGNAELAARHAEDPGTVRAQVAKVEAAALRASELTGQMLTYTGNAQIEKKRVDLNEVVAEVAALMRVAISKKASLRLDLGEDLPDVVGDPVQMSQVILNLITNASEALGTEGGSIVLRTGVVRPDETFQRWSVGPPPQDLGEHVFLEAEDSGRGMDPATLSKIFDPFFTTKFKGRGLGLATVLGIVRAHSGLTRVASEPGKGTRFTVALPAAQRLPLSASRGADDGEPWRGTGVALLADDEPEVRQVMHRMLAAAGFTVIEAADGREAVAAFEARSSEIDLVVMDRTMPVMDGGQALERIRALSADMPAIFVSGYTDTPTYGDDPLTKVLHKPFKAATLAAAVRDVMRGGKDRSEEPT